MGGEGGRLGVSVSLLSLQERRLLPEAEANPRADTLLSCSVLSRHLASYLVLKSHFIQKVEKSEKN